MSSYLPIKKRWSVLHTETQEYLPSKSNMRMVSSPLSDLDGAVSGKILTKYLLTISTGLPRVGLFPKVLVDVKPSALRHVGSF
jgi:hypothetical protein